MLAVKGTIQGNTVVIKDEDIKKYDGKKVIHKIGKFCYQKIIFNFILNTNLSIQIIISFFVSLFL